jgi:hypothetical protein
MPICLFIDCPLANQATGAIVNLTTGMRHSVIGYVANEFAWPKHEAANIKDPAPFLAEGAQPTFSRLENEGQ